MRLFTGLLGASLLFFASITEGQTGGHYQMDRIDRNVQQNSQQLQQIRRTVDQNQQQLRRMERQLDNIERMLRNTGGGSGNYRVIESQVDLTCLDQLLTGSWVSDKDEDKLRAAKDCRSFNPSRNDQCFVLETKFDDECFQKLDYRLANAAQRRAYREACQSLTYECLR